jgi:hypothetical protein
MILHYKKFNNYNKMMIKWQLCMMIILLIYKIKFNQIKIIYHNYNKYHNNYKIYK